MAYTWHPTNHPGVRYREHPTRKHGIKPDRYFSIYYRVDGKRHEEGLGWASDKMTVEKAAGMLSKLKEAQRTGEGAATLREKRQAAEARRKDAQAERERQAREGISLNVFWANDYFIALKNRVKACSWEKEESHFRMWLSPALGVLPLREISDADLERIQDRMRASGLSDRSQEYILGTFRRIWKHGIKRKIVSAECPVSKLNIRRPNNSRLRVLKPEEFQTILSELAVTDETACDLTLFAALTGCRASEAFNLKWEHVDLDRECVLFPETKNREPREVFLCSNLVKMLERRGPQTAGGHVFTKKDGTPYTEAPSAFRTIVQRLGLNDGRPPRERISFHNLRHSAATFAARRGVPVKDMQEIFGWKTPSMVFRYAKGSEDVKRRAMRTLEQALKSKSGKVVEFPGGQAAAGDEE